VKLYLRQGPNWTTHSFISNPYKAHRNILYSHGRFGFAIWLAAKITVDLEFRNNKTRITSSLIVTGSSE
jgi:hypothetical protein